MKSAYSLLIVVLLLAVGCEQEPILSVNTGSLEFSGDGGTNTVPFMANKTWTASSSATWCKISPSSGDASDNNNVSLTVTCDKNTTYEDRTCTITISSEGLTGSVSVKQLMNYGLLAVQTSYELTPLAQELKVELRSNVNYQVSVDAGSTGWLKVVSTKGLESHTIVLEVGENTTGASRRGAVTIKDVQNGLSETVMVSQRPNPTGKVKNPDVASNLPGEANSFELDFETNVSYFTIDTPDWVTVKEQKVETRETISLHAVFAVSANTTKDIRRGEIVLRTTDGTDMAFLKVQVLQNPLPFGIEVSDAYFKSYLVKHFDTDKDGEISEEEAAAVEKIEIETDKISSLDAISEFSNLKSLICRGSSSTSEGGSGQLSSLDISKNTKLEELDCSNNQIASLDISKNISLTALGCGSNNISKLDISMNSSLMELDCSSNEIASLDVSKNMSLKELNCEDNKLSELDLTQNRELTSLYCAENQMTSIDVSNNGKLQDYRSDKIDFEDKNFKKYVTSNLDKNKDGNVCLVEASMTGIIEVATDNIKTMKELQSFPNLKKLVCSGSKKDAIGQLSEIDLSNNKKLVELDCSNNLISKLDISKNSDLVDLSCEKNQLSAIDISANKKLAVLECSKNDLTQLDVSNNKAVSKLDCSANQLSSIDLTHNASLSELNCSDNLLSALDVSKNEALTVLNCADNQLTELNISNNVELTTLNCSGNKITNVDVSNNPKLVNHQADNITFADSNFKKYIVGKYDENGDGEISLVEASRVDYISVNTDDIQSVNDIKNFANLRSLICLGTFDYSYEYGETGQGGSGKLTSLDVSNNKKLTYLNCGGNQLTELDVSSNLELGGLRCLYNHLADIDVSNNKKLYYLDCWGNQLSKLDVSHNENLEELWCDFNELTYLDVSHNVVLEHLNVQHNKITSLDLSHNSKLKFFTCYSNQVNKLLLPASLVVLKCASNQLTSLDVSSCISLDSLYCSQNQISNLNISKNPSLMYISCGENQLESLDISCCTALNKVWCYDNRLSKLNIGKNSSLTLISCRDNNLKSLDVSGCTSLDSIWCYNNQLTNLDVSNLYALSFLGCWDNQLKNLNVSNCTNLHHLYCYNNELTTLNVSTCSSLSLLSCFSNSLTTLDVSENSLLDALYCYYNPNLTEIWLRTGQTINTFVYDSNVATIKYKSVGLSSVSSKRKYSVGVQHNNLHPKADIEGADRQVENNRMDNPEKYEHPRHR